MMNILAVFLLGLALFSGMFSYAYAGKGKAEAKVLSWGRNPQTGEVIVILSFRPAEWQVFNSYYGPLTPTHRKVSFPIPKRQNQIKSYFDGQDGGGSSPRHL